MSAALRHTRVSAQSVIFPAAATLTILTLSCPFDSSCRDIKLENLFISSRGHLQLGDFGLAISVLEERAISPVGTLEYMAPEILRLPSTGNSTTSEHTPNVAVQQMLR
jgi:hypothetical protein